MRSKVCTTSGWLVNVCAVVATSVVSAESQRLKVKSETLTSQLFSVFLFQCIFSAFLAAVEWSTAWLFTLGLRARIFYTHKETGEAVREGLQHSNHFTSLAFMQKWIK